MFWAGVRGVVQGEHNSREVVGAEKPTTRQTDKEEKKTMQQMIWTGIEREAAGRRIRR